MFQPKPIILCSLLLIKMGQIKKKNRHVVHADCSKSCSICTFLIIEKHKPKILPAVETWSLKLYKWAHTSQAISVRHGCLQQMETSGNKAGRYTFSDTEAKPLVGCCVLMSKTWNLPSSEVATSLFMSMSFLSNSTEQTCPRTQGIKVRQAG